MIGAAAALDVYGDIDPVPKTMTIDVVPSPDFNSDGVVNGLDVSYVASRWGTAPFNGQAIAAIASHWLETVSQHVDEENLSLIAANYQQTVGASLGGVETHLAPIYPPCAAGVAL